MPVSVGSPEKHGPGNEPCPDKPVGPVNPKSPTAPGTCDNDAVNPGPEPAPAAVVAVALQEARDESKVSKQLAEKKEQANEDDTEVSDANNTEQDDEDEQDDADDPNDEVDEDVQKPQKRVRIGTGTRGTHARRTKDLPETQPTSHTPSPSNSKKAKTQVKKC